MAFRTPQLDPFSLAVICAHLAGCSSPSAEPKNTEKTAPFPEASDTSEADAELNVAPLIELDHPPEEKDEWSECESVSQEATESLKPQDIILVVDNSGSMGTKSTPFKIESTTT